MKNIVIAALIAMLALAAIGPVGAVSADSPDMVGRVVFSHNNPGFSGDLRLMSDGTISGNCDWTVFNFCGMPVMFRCNKMDNLSFPGEHTAVFSGSFTCNDICIYTGDPVWECELSFVLTEREIGNETNPSGLPVAVPPGISLPAGPDTLEVYCSGGQLITTQRGDYAVTVH